jgi:hypothetical protein
MRPALSSSRNGNSGSCHSCDGTAGSRGGRRTISVLKGHSLGKLHCSWLISSPYDTRGMRLHVTVDEGGAIDFGTLVLDTAMH